MARRARRKRRASADRHLARPHVWIQFAAPRYGTWQCTTAVWHSDEWHKVDIASKAERRADRATPIAIRHAHGATTVARQEPTSTRRTVTARRAAGRADTPSPASADTARAPPPAEASEARTSMIGSMEKWRPRRRVARQARPVTKRRSGSGTGEIVPRRAPPRAGPYPPTCSHAAVLERYRLPDSTHAQARRYDA